MSADDSLLFIDANKYLDLYRTNSGKILLGPLVEQAENIFVTQQVVAEVKRNKNGVVAEFLTKQLKSLQIGAFNVPDHLAGPSRAKILSLMRKLGDLVRDVNAEVDSMIRRILEEVSLSKDDVSSALSQIFSKAVPHTDQELERARSRRELGNPPGKYQNPIGDQLTWEQILTRFTGKTRLWIISRDGDYGTVLDGKGFVNQFLRDELRAISASAEIHLFQDTLEGIQHFVNETGVKAEIKLSPDQIKEIETEEKSLPSLSNPGIPLIDWSLGTPLKRWSLGNRTFTDSELHEHIRNNEIVFSYHPVSPNEVGLTHFSEIDLANISSANESFRKICGELPPPEDPLPPPESPIPPPKNY